MSPTVPAAARHSKLRSQLIDRRQRLETTIATLNQPRDLVRLLAEVDSALSRLEGGDFGVCQVCLEQVEEDDLLANPMASYCLCKLTPERQRALERDLDLAWQVQAALLPPLGLDAGGWRTHYRYVPHGPVSGDYCDLVVPHGGAAGMYFMLGDVSGKGVAASLLMAHLNALLRSLAQEALSPSEVMNRANRMLAESTLASHYATLVCGRANASGEVEIVNAGHCSPVVVRAHGSVEVLHAGGLPLGLSIPAESAPRYAAERVALRDGDVLVLYTDGLTEAAASHGEDYGMGRLVAILKRSAGDAPRELIAKCLNDLAAFLGPEGRNDDLTILALGRSKGGSHEIA
jgi:sigma-B regulation protein RsbU (phosphoserine phosphatase)